MLSKFVCVQLVIIPFFHILLIIRIASTFCKSKLAVSEKIVELVVVVAVCAVIIKVAVTI